MSEQVCDVEIASGVDGPTAQTFDLRLALGATLAWLAVAALLDRSPALILWCALGSVAVGGGLLAGARSLRWVPALAMVLFCIALELLPLAARVEDARASPLADLAVRHAQVSLTVTVTDDPRQLAAKGVAGVPRVAVSAEVERLEHAGRSASADGDVLILGEQRPWREVLPGQRVRVAGALQPDLDGGALSVTLFERAPPELLGRAPWWQRAAGRVRTDLRSSAAVLPEPDRGLLPGLIDGDTGNLDPVLIERFRLAGLTHLVAVSGTNCSIVIGTVLLLLRRSRTRPAVRAAVAFGVLLAFVVVARPSPSVLRAAFMATIMLVSLASGRSRSAVPVLAASVLGLLLWDPTLAVSASFTMSVLATAAVLLVAPGWARRLRARRVPRGLAEAVAVAAAAHVVTAPVVAALSGRVSVVAIPANVLAEPVVAVVTVVGFAAAVVAPLWSGAGEVLAWAAGWPCRWLVWVADFFGGLHGATLAWPSGVLGGLALAAVSIAVWVLALRAGVRRVLVAVALTVITLLIPVRAATSSWPPGGWVFAACDVGQGDALLLAAGPGAAVEIDAGPDPVAIDRCLRDFGITHIPLLVLTHYHLDHVAGLPGVIRGRRVDQIVTGPLAEPAEGASDVARAAAAEGDTVLNPPIGTVLNVGAVHLQVLGPRAAFHGTRSDPNNSSLVLMATVRGVRIILPGDAEIEAQQQLLASGVDLHADVLKVPHHGSAYFDPTFLAAVHAQVAVVSVGLHNDYGHPSPVLLGEMARLGVPLLRTDHDGDVAVRGSPGHLVAVAHGTAASTVGAPARRPGNSDVITTVSSQALASETGRGAVSRSTPSLDAAPTPSVAGARMAACPLDRSTSTTCPNRCLRCSCSWATRNCSSTAPSARSPPPPGAPIPASSSHD